MKRAMYLLIAGTILSGIAALSASGQASERTDCAAAGPADPCEGFGHDGHGLASAGTTPVAAR